MNSYYFKEPTKIKDGKIYVHSAKKYCDIVKELPEEAVFWKVSGGSIPVGIVGKEIRKNKTVYHIHKVNGSATFTGSHLVYIIRN